MLSSPPLNDQHFLKFMRGQDNDDFYFFLKFTIFFTKRATGWYFYYYGIVLK